MKKNILLSPHDDDSVLFAAFTCMREKPLVVICFDSYVQPNRGETGCSADERARESWKAHAILDCQVLRLGLRDDKATEDDLIRKIRNTPGMLTDFEVVYAPAMQGGHEQHDMVAKVAKQLWGNKVIEYMTYSKQALYTTGDRELVPTEEELDLKKSAMDCYESQLRLNLAHFRAVFGKSEWTADPMVTTQSDARELATGTYLVAKNYSGNLTQLHLGCGKDLKKDWINLDRMAGADVVFDFCWGVQLPFDDNSMDKVYSADFLEHLPPEKGVPAMNEIWRVLKPGGTMEHFVPNAGTANDFGSPTHLSHWSRQVFEHFDVDSYRWAKDREFEGFIGKFKKVISEVINSRIEEDGIKRFQSVHVVYAAIKD